MQSTPKKTPPARAERAGWQLDEWLPAVSISRAKFYSMPATMRPKSVHLGTRRIIVESPKEYLGRIAALQTSADAA